MDGIKYAVLTDKSCRLRSQNQYTSNVESGFTKTEIKYWVELLFGVKVIAMNSHRLPGTRRTPLGHRMQYRRMIITLEPGDSIPFLTNDQILIKNEKKEWPPKRKLKTQKLTNPILLQRHELQSQTVKSNPIHAII